MTETLSHIAARALNGKGKSEEYRLLEGVAINQDEDGCLIISMPPNSEKVFTNDVVDKTSERSFTWLGRKDNVINSGAHKIHPEEIERVLGSYIDKPLMVSSLPDSKLGENVSVSSPVTASMANLSTSAPPLIE